MTIDGVQIAETVLTRLRDLLKEFDRMPGLAALVAGDDPRLKKFVQLKKKTAERIGIQFSSYEFRGNVGQDEIFEVIRWLNEDDTIDGILVELPLPKQLDPQGILDAITSAKDVDVLSGERQRAYYGDTPELLPPAVGALKALIQAHNIQIKGKRAAVFGQSMLIGKPVAHWLERQGAAVNRIDEHTKHPERFSREADIVVSGVGKPGLITGNMIKEGAVVIDYGYERKPFDSAQAEHSPKANVLGDVDFESVSPKAKLITPVPGGMGPIVIAALMENLLLIASRSRL